MIIFLSSIFSNSNLNVALSPPQPRKNEVQKETEGMGNSEGNSEAIFAPLKPSGFSILADLRTLSI